MLLLLVETPRESSDSQDVISEPVIAQTSPVAMVAVELPPPPQSKPEPKPLASQDLFSKSGAKKDAKQSTGSESSLEDEVRAKKILRALERGEGPQIRIAWPRSRSARERLFRYLHRCLGMRLAIFDGSRLSAIEPGIAIPMSGYVRLISGSTSRAEQQILGRLGAMGMPVRMFPRQVDLLVLTNLTAVIGSDLLQTRELRAEYILNGSEWSLGHLMVDARTISGTISLPTEAQCPRSII